MSVLTLSVVQKKQMKGQEKIVRAKFAVRVFLFFRLNVFALVQSFAEKLIKILQFGMFFAHHKNAPLKSD